MNPPHYTFMDRVRIHQFKRDLNTALFEVDGPKAPVKFHERPDWFQKPMYYADTWLLKHGHKMMPWAIIRPFDVAFDAYYATKRAFWDACLFCCIKLGKIKQ